MSNLNATNVIVPVDTPPEEVAPAPAPATPEPALAKDQLVRYTYTGPSGPVSRLGMVVVTHDATEAHPAGFATVAWLPADALSGHIPIDQLEAVAAEEV